MGEVSKEAMELAERIVAVEIPHHAGRKDVKESIANAIDAHTASKDAEIERWKREAMAARVELNSWRSTYGVVGEIGNIGSVQCRFCRLITEHNRRDHPYHSETCIAAKTDAARAANGATP